MNSFGIWQERIFHALFGFISGLAILAVIALATSCAGKKPAKQNVIEVPKHCVIVDNIWECDARNICKAHVTVKPIPECNAYNRNILQVKK